MVHFIIINGFNQSIIWVWNRLMGIFQEIIWGVNLYIHIINCMIINSHHDIWNHRTGIWIRGKGFKVNWCSLVVPLAWWFIWFVTMKLIELIHISPKNEWGHFIITNYAWVILVSKYSTESTDSILHNMDICNEYMQRSCRIIVGIWITKRVRATTWLSQFIWGSNHVQVTVYTIHITSCVYSQFLIFQVIW